MRRPLFAGAGRCPGEELRLEFTGRTGGEHASLEALDAATLTGKHKVMGRDLSVTDTALAIGGDLHEHLGQMIAYARVNHIVPPWSK